MLNHTLNLTKIIISVKSWPPFQLLCCLTEVLLSFTALILLTAGVTERDALGLMGILMLASSVVIITMKKTYKKHEFVPSFLLSIIGITALTTYLLLENESRFLFFVLGVGLALASRDLEMSRVMTKVRLKAISKGVELSQITALMMISGACLTVLFTALVGIAIDKDIEFGIKLVTYLMIALTIGNATTRWKAGAAPKPVELEEPACKIHNVKASSSIYVLCTLSTIYNATSFVGKRFIVPLLALKVSEKLGFSDSVFTSLAMVVGFMTLINLIKPRKKASSGKKLMLDNFYIGMTCWILIALGFYSLEHISRDFVIILIALLLLTYLVLEASTKLWSVGFIDELKGLSERDSVEYQHRSDTYQHYLNIYMYMRNIGGSLGFLIAYLIYTNVGIFFTMFGLSIAAICYGLIAERILYSKVKMLNT